jgi:hypothetical protein
MSLFTSNRERRLWLWALAVVIAIYSTLGLARTLAGQLRTHGLLESLFMVSFLLVGAVILAYGLKVRPGGLEIGVALGVAAVYILIFVRMATPEERTHLIEYGVLSVFIYEALKERASQGRRVPVPALLAVIAASLIGLIDENIQAFLPNRTYDERDLLFNVLAAVMAVAASMALSYARRWRFRSTPD